MGICKMDVCIGKDNCALLKYYLEEQAADEKLLKELRKGSKAWEIVRKHVRMNEAERRA